MKKKQHSAPTLLKWKTRKTAQESIPYERINDDGIAELGGGFYSATYSMSDINYNNLSEASRLSVFENYCTFLNMLDPSLSVQLHVHNKQLSTLDLSVFLNSPENVADIKQSDLLNSCVDVYNEQMAERMTGTDSYTQKKYITITIRANNSDEAQQCFARIEAETLNGMKSLDCATHRLDYPQRLYLLRDIYRPDDKSEISPMAMSRSGIYGKDLVAPYGIDTSTEEYIKLGEYYTKTLFLTDFPFELSDQVIKNIMAVKNNIFVTMNLIPQNPQTAIEQTRTKLKHLDKEKYDSIDRQVKMRVLLPEIPRDLQKAIENTEAFLKELETRNEKMFLSNILIFIRAKSAEELRVLTDSVRGEVSKTGCTLQKFSFLHEDGLNSVVPLGRNDTFVKRTLTTSAVAAFIPFNVIDIMEKGGLCYGKNILSNNLIFLDRKKMTNANAFYFGVSGSGKSMGAKAEIFECFLRTNDDMIIIDPDGEFTPLIKALGGQIIELSPTSGINFNPLDINENYGGEEEPDPIPFKSDFIISLLTVTLNLREETIPIMRSVIDRCVRSIYVPYMKSRSQNDVPTFSEFFEALKKQPEPEAAYLTSSLEIYIQGSLNIFAKKSNIQFNNRVICFNTKNLAENARTMGMSIIQDYCWNLISKNQKLNHHTWLWYDEVHLSLKNPTMAAWVTSAWKRGRKYGLIPTGMTQEINDCCKNEEAKTLIANSEFILLYRQRDSMLESVSKVVQLSKNQLNNLLSYDSGMGLLKSGNSVVEFNNRYKKDTILYDLMKTTIDGKQSV